MLFMRTLKTGVRHEQRVPGLLSAILAHIHTSALRKNMVVIGAVRAITAGEIRISP